LLGEDVSAPYLYEWSGIPAGVHAITAIATDNSSATASSAAISITVGAPNQLPLCTITSPADNAAFTAPTSLPIAVEASDPDGTVAKVTFYGDGVMLGEDASAPYSYEWSNIPAGIHTITAIATDNTSAITTSAPIAVSFKAPKPPILQFPQNLERNTLANPVFKWYSQDKFVIFQVQVSEDENFAAVQVDSILKDTIYEMINKNIRYNSTNFWRVRVKDSTITSEWSEVWQFSTKPPLPDKVTLVMPVSDMVFNVDSANLFWLKVPFCDRYMVRIAADPTMESIVGEDSLITDTMCVQRGFQNNTTLWWSVKAHNVSGWGEFSLPQKFSIKIPTTSTIIRNYIQFSKGVSSSRHIIEYGVSEGTNVSIRIFTVQGKLVRTVVNSYQNCGSYSVSVPTSSFSKGYYILCLKTRSFSMKRGFIISM
jgi:hypothetical protein